MILLWRLTVIIGLLTYPKNHRMHATAQNVGWEGSEHEAHGQRKDTNALGVFQSSAAVAWIGISAGLVNHGRAWCLLPRSP